MKLLLLSLTMFATVSSYASCISAGKLSVCSNDIAYVGDAEGRVVGINPVSGIVSIDFTSGYTNGYSGVGTYSLNSITIGRGCISSVCVGQRVYVNGGEGRIVALNPNTQKVTVDFRQGYTDYSGIGTYNIRNITLP